MAAAVARVRVRAAEPPPASLASINGFIDALWIVDGLVRGSGGDSALDQPRAEMAARVMDALAERKELSERVSEIDVSDLRDVVVILDGETAQLHLGDDHFVTRLQSYVDLAPTLRERVDPIDSVDLRFDDRVYVRPGAPDRKTSGGRR